MRHHTILAVAICLFVTAGSALAAGITLQPNESQPVAGANDCPITYTRHDASHGTLSCGPSAGHDPSRWHAPADHEHGDAPPQWITDAGYRVGFDEHGGFHGGTSAAENTAKHAAMKGFSATFNGTDVYFRVHAASNPLDRSARFHSYEVWARDPQAGVSHWQGWYDSGDPTPGGPGRVVRYPNGDGRRPIIFVVDRATWFDGHISTEQWYTTTAPWSWEWGWNIGKTTTFYRPDENQHPTQDAWEPTGGLGQARGLEATWPADSRNVPRGTFWATQFGDRVSGPTDAACSAPSVRYGVSYTTICLEQAISPTMPAIGFGMPGGNSRSKAYDSPGLRLPN